MKRNKNYYLRIIILLSIMLLISVFVINNSSDILKGFYPLRYREYVEMYGYENGIDSFLVYAIIKAESGFREKALSPQNAMGLMQITEKTAFWGADELDIRDFRLEMLYDPGMNIKIGCWYFKRLMEEFNNVMDNALAAYNGGSGNVSKWLQDPDLSSDGISLDRIPFSETDKYVKRVKNYYNIYKMLYGKEN